jgi:succinate-acetate transporter protein
MAVLMLIFMICATRTNVVYTLIFLSLLVVFLLLSSAYWRLADGDAAVGDRCVKVSKCSCLSLFFGRVHIR